MNRIEVLLSGVCYLLMLTFPRDHQPLPAALDHLTALEFLAALQLLVALDPLTALEFPAALQLLVTLEGLDLVVRERSPSYLHMGIVNNPG